MTTTTAKEYLAQASLLRLVGVMALVLAPHVAHLPPWLTVSAMLVGAWRVAAALKQWPLPPTWLRVILVMAAFVGVSVTYGRLNGQGPSTALLSIMLMLKLTEMRTRRDVLVVVSLCYFVMFTHFLFNQDPWTVLYLMACAVAVTAVLVEVNHLGEPLRPRTSLRLGATLAAQAVPLMVVFFVLFPRLPGPLWGLPSDAGAARSGITDQMAPGDIARLIGSDEIAFRVRFFGAPPPMRERYWRGPVFAYTDGARWWAPFGGDNYFRYPNLRLAAYEKTPVELLDGAVRYEMQLEPHRQNWLFGMDLVSTEALSPDFHVTGYHQLIARETVKEPLTYQAVAYTRYRLQPELPPSWRATNLRLPSGRNPRTLALAREWREAGLDDRQVVQRLLTMFRQEQFHYTLEPPRLGPDMADEFLFVTRRGFCEHYAGSFTTLMRAAGIPARVVVGYMGGDLNDVGDYYIVRQADAHAWSEVWLEGQGWVRVDPTAAVAPSRVETGIATALAPAEVPGFLQRGGDFGFLAYWRLRADVAWDYVNVVWDRWILAYGPQLQMEFLSRFGLDNWQNMVLALTGIVTAVMALVGLLLMRQLRPVKPADRALLLWRRALRRLARHGLRQRPDEGPQDFAERVIHERPELAPAMRQLVKAYVAARYTDAPSEAVDSTLVMAARGLKV